MTTLRWLTVPRTAGVTCGVPWPRGTVPAGAPFAARADDAHRTAVPVQSWVTATWPDGSVQWSAHAFGPQARPASAYTLVAGDPPAATPAAVEVTGSGDAIVVATGAATWVVPRHGPALVRTVHCADREIARDARLISLWDDTPESDAAGTVHRRQLRGQVESATVEQAGPVRAVVRLTGRHIPEDDRPGPSLLPFTVRLYFYAGAAEVRLMHTLVWEGDGDCFLAGLGLRTDIPMRDEPHDRHVRLAGPAGPDGRPGFLTEAVRGITGLRRDPGAAARAAQVAGRPCGPVTDWPETVSRRLHLVPAFGDWTLDQTGPDGFTLAKRTAPGHAWVTIPAGNRAAGYGYAGGVGGGLGFGLRDFWRLYPTRLDVRAAATDTATATVWLWSPSAPAMDLRFYHDGRGQDTFAEQLEALEITYEDCEPGFGDPRGIARTHELVLRPYAATPGADTLAADAAALNDPPLLVAEPSRLHAAGVFGDWSPADRSTPPRAGIEDRLDFLFGFYAGQREQRRWYGFWDYGDVMHAYDPDRHQWRYDVGGYAWDNSELSPDLWLWYQFLRTGRADVFRFAEAMTRHTGEVDVYHSGPWRGLGSRHNVQHWGCSCKQLRISSAIYRRFHYYLTADERTGDLLREVATAERALLAVDPSRKIRDAVPRPGAAPMGLGTDWGALAAAWLTEWERTGDEHARTAARDKLLTSMADIGALPHGFFTAEARLDPDTGHVTPAGERPGASHLSAVFGLAEICSELVALTAGTHIGATFEAAWLRYCRLYLAPPEVQRAELGQALTGISLIQAHSRLAAYAAARTGDPDLAALAWHAFHEGVGDQLNTNPLQSEPVWRTTSVASPQVLTPVDEAAYISTNDAAQYGLAAIQLLALVADGTVAPKR
ncbi:hypothetical protein ACPPVO_47850 [Dactylosporangium sp. McL0621]|uniref:exo-rhamnogalacturonan lyase family protein n=1 Tax=Dactylosporangium sp. McL0621 TaxID=3415678 RepID=UPI003CF9DA1C